MTSKETVDAILRLLEAVTTWPVVSLVVAFVFREQISSGLPELLRRLRKAPGGWEFDELEAVKAELADLSNTKEVQTDQEQHSLDVDPKSVQLTHTAEPAEPGKWRVRVWLDAPQEFLDQVATVTYERHPTFKNRTKDVVDAPFVDKFRCWGAFTIKAQIHLQNGTIIRRQRFLALDSDPN